MNINLGNKTKFLNSITELLLNNHTYILDYKSKEPQLYSSNCPHQGGTVKYSEKDSCFVCPVHNWKFSTKTGQSINAPKNRLTSFSVFEKRGNLYVDLPDELINEKQENNSKVEKSNVTVKLHAHACLEIKYDKFNLLCDPWLEGNAFLGAWAHYPPTVSKVNDLKPNAIWISHEHSDHFHEPTLSKFDKTIPIYVPAFPNGRMESKLKQLGFNNVYAVPFGEKLNLTSDFSITIYEPASLWNDAFVLMEVDGLRILNLNDAGINRNIARKIGPVDIVASSFSPGASGYPATWTHLSINEKKKIMKQSKSGILKMLEQATEVYQAKKILPFASHFTLWHEFHESYYKTMQKNDLSDVTNHFESSEIDVIDLLPGDSWFSLTNQITRSNKEIPLLTDYILEQQVKNETPLPLQKKSIDEKTVVNYFEKLNNVPEMCFSENLVFQLKWGLNVLYFKIFDGILTRVKPLSNPNLVIKISPALLRWIVQENESWDEATIGYWCEFSRNPDIYHADFWRLLQAPYYQKSAQVSSYTGNTSIAEILEEKGESAARIMGRYGLHCVGCSSSIEETLEQGIQAHGLSMGDRQRLLEELNLVNKGEAQ